MSGDAAFVGSIPQHYDQGLGPLIFVDYAADIARRAAALKPSRVLETAAGTGIVTRRLRDALPASTHLISTDLNAPMLEVARKKFKNGEQVEFQPADATALPFGDGSFDAIVCQFGMMFYPDKDKSYREAFRLLTPGGTYLFSVWDSHRYNIYGRIADDNARKFFPNDPPQFYKVPFSCHQIDPIKEGLRAAGFGNIDIAVMPLQKDIPDAAAFARGIVYGNPLYDQIMARGGVTPEQVFESVVQDLRREFGADPGRMPIQAIVFAARKPKA